MPRDRTILVVVDPTADEQPALGRAASLAEALDATLELFICDYDQHLAAHPLFDSAGLEKARRSLLDGHVERLRELARPMTDRGLRVELDARWGRPLHRGVLRKVVDSAPLLVVKDTHYHDALKRTLLSNTDWNLIRACPAPLLLVKPRPMGSPPTLLAAVDPMHEHDKPSALDRSILSFASDLAAKLHGRLHVLHAYDTAPVLAAASATTPVAMASVPVADIASSLESEHRAALEALVADYPGIDAAGVHLEEGAPSRCIAHKAAEHAVDFVVMGAVSRSGLQRIFVGSTAEQTLDRLPCDLIVVKSPGFQVPEAD
ncbi:MAG: universal stress protein [Gammaproteobacteria bacterium]|nr:universal stress protein [Gammaproteobacteria bacterium]